MEGRVLGRGCCWRYCGNNISFIYWLDKMTISRASMGSQMKGNRMKKVKKMKGGGNMLENLSPAYSLMKGKGLPHDLITGGGVLGALSKAMDKKKSGSADPASAQPQAGAGMAANQMQGMTPMYKGGAVKKSRDGIAQRGKTRGKYC